MDTKRSYNGYVIRAATYHTPRGRMAEARVRQHQGSTLVEWPPLSPAELRVLPTAEEARESAFTLGKNWVARCG